ncbi:Ger(x)C family spore germination protein [Sporomusa sp.]|uniref:Ger(x)C family spore germination protein n=1 Tax=Sporomusa sp. TaxID=2078658 RepID=UPI002BA22DF6|nr:Ger(x)C family spore germination protein [Sporomusa sp.]HWR44289.1 Ger(x)C family spore germination protein [Sporomusa sp.]
MVTKFFCFVLLAAAIGSAGCTGFYQDINKSLLITSVLVDVGENGEPKIYFEGFRPKRASGKDKKEDRAIFIISGKTVSEVIDSLNATASNKPNFGHTKVVLFSRRAAEAGLAKYTDLFARDQEHLLRSYVALFDGKPEDLFSAKLPGDEFLGLHCYDLFRYYNLKSAKLMEVQVKDLFNGRYDYSRTSVLPVLTLTKHVEKIPGVSGAAVLRDFRLVTILPEQEVPYYSLFQDSDQVSVYTIDNPIYPGSYVSLQTVNAHIRTKVAYNGTNITLTKKLELDLTFREAQNGINLTPDQREQIKKSLAQNLKTECDSFFDKYKAESVDIFNLEEMFRRKYPNEKVDNPLGKTILDLVININIEGSGHYKSFD